MKTHYKAIAFLILVLLLSSSPACGTPVPTATPVPTPTPTPTPEPPGTVSGKVVYKNLTSPGNAEPMADVLIALCLITDEGPPEGPPVATKNRDETEHICTLQGEPTALTGTDGAFTLDGVSPGDYLVLFHLFPSELHETEWHGVILTEAVVDEAEMAVAPSGESDFWQAGGPAISLMNWKAGEGMTLSHGNVCSDKFGFCFSIRDEDLSPVIELESHQTVEVELIAHFKPGKK
jgi:hypothetical protein